MVHRGTTVARLVQFSEINETEKRMRSLFLGLPVLGASAFTLVTGCASQSPPPVMPQPTLAAIVAAPPPEAPSAEAAAVPDHDLAPAPERVKHHVEITVDHLPAPRAFDAAATTYVFWVRASDEDAWANAAHLDRSDTSQEARFDFAEDVLFVHVTAEPSAEVRQPSAKVVLSTRVSRSGACAQSVDEHDVSMKVRMCR
jgi:hypothetical protein